MSTTVSSSGTQDLAKDQNVPNELSFHQVCDDPNSQRYVCQLKMSRRSTLKSHYLDDQESDEQLSSICHTYNSESKPQSENSNIYPTKSNADDIIKPTALSETTIIKTSIDNTTTYYQNGNAVKRGCEDADNDDYSNASSSSLSGTSVGVTRRSPPKKPKFVVTYKEMREFFNLLNEESIRQFLIRDSCCLISDKYALAMVFTYFKRAKFHLNEFTRINFYLALYLASDIEEDIDEYKYEIFPWALGSRWRTKFTGFLKKRDALLRRIGYRAIVSRKCCEEVMSLAPEHYAWKRERSEDHGGATRAYTISKCRRMHSEANRLGDEVELSLPRGPYENPRPCSICLVKQYTTKKTPINEFIPTMSHHGRLSSVASTISNSTIGTTHQENNDDSKLSDRSKITYHEEDANENDEIINKSKTLKANRSILKPSQATNIYLNEKQQQTNKYTHKTENDENRNIDINNNFAANKKKINNLILNENIFMYKNTHNYQKILLGECNNNSSNDIDRNNQKYQDYLDSTDEDENEENSSTNEEDEENENCDDYDDDDETDDCNEDDDVFAKPNLKHHHSNYFNGHHNQLIKNLHNGTALNSRKTCHPNKWSSNGIASSNTISRDSTKKRPTCSLSASANLLIVNNVKAKNNIKNGDMLSTSYPKQQLINDQLVPREVLIAKNC